jgi:hypothetical protein
MRKRDGWPRQQIIFLSSVLAASACATQIDGVVDSEVPIPSGGVGGDAAGMSATGGATSVAGVPSTGGTGGTGMAGAPGAVGGTGNTGAGASTGGTTGGTTATGGRGGTVATGGAVAAGGTDGSGAAASGCAKLSVPLNGANDKAHFVVSLEEPTDLSAPGTTISLDVYVEAGSGGVIFAYAQDASFNFLGAATRPLLAEQSGWVTLGWDIAAEPAVLPAIMKRNVTRIGIEIKAAPSATWSNPTIVYVDSISVNTPALTFPFGTATTVSAMARASDPAGQSLWLNSGTDDTTASGSTLSWVADCP